MYVQRRPPCRKLRRTPITPPSHLRPDSSTLPRLDCHFAPHLLYARAPANGHCTDRPCHCMLAHAMRPIASGWTRRPLCPYACTFVRAVIPRSGRPHLATTPLDNRTARRHRLHTRAQPLPSLCISTETALAQPNIRSTTPPYPPPEVPLRFPPIPAGAYAHAQVRPIASGSTPQYPSSHSSTLVPPASSAASGAAAATVNAQLANLLALTAKQQQEQQQKEQQTPQG